RGIEPGPPARARPDRRADRTRRAGDGPAQSPGADPGLDPGAWRAARRSFAARRPAGDGRAYHQSFARQLGRGLVDTEATGVLMQAGGTDVVWLRASGSGVATRGQ